MCDKGRIVGIADNDPGDAFCATVGMECVGWNGMSAKSHADGEAAMKRWWSSTFLFDILPLAGFCPFCDGLTEKRHELAVA